jgi:hypothetical protein
VYQPVILQCNPARIPAGACARYSLVLPDALFLFGQQAEIKKRDEESKRKKEETVLKAEKAIDAFYENYNAEKEKSIRKNK